MCVFLENVSLDSQVEFCPPGCVHTRTKGSDVQKIIRSEGCDIWKRWRNSKVSRFQS